MSECILCELISEFFNEYSVMSSEDYDNALIESERLKELKEISK